MWSERSRSFTDSDTRRHESCEEPADDTIDVETIHDKQTSVRFILNNETNIKSFNTLNYTSINLGDVESNKLSHLKHDNTDNNLSYFGNKHQPDVSSDAHNTHTHNTNTHNTDAHNTDTHNIDTHNIHTHNTQNKDTHNIDLHNTVSPSIKSHQNIICDSPNESGKDLSSCDAIPSAVHPGDKSELPVSAGCQKFRPWESLHHDQSMDHNTPDSS